jgi:hypothetical protein
MYLIRVLAGPVANVGASTIAGKMPITTLNIGTSPSSLGTARGGEFPYSPFTRVGYSGAVPDNASDPYGFQIGNQYTFRWGAPGNNSSCGTEGNYPSCPASSCILAQNGGPRGYCCDNNGATLRQTIVSGDTDQIPVGQPVPMQTGSINTENSAIAWRVQLDTDQNSPNYQSYISNGKGNGTRIVVVPVNNGPPNYINIGYAGFFLLTANYYNGLNGNQSACAEYIGGWTEGQRQANPAGSGAWRVRMFK